MVVQVHVCIYILTSSEESGSLPPFPPPPPIAVSCPCGCVGVCVSLGSIWESLTSRGGVLFYASMWSDDVCVCVCV